MHVYFWYLMLILFLSFADLSQRETDVITSEYRRDTTYFTMHQSQYLYSNPAYTADYYHVTNVTLYGNTVHLHRRVARQARRLINPGGSGGGNSGADVAQSEFLRYEWWHPKLISISFFGLSTVIAYMRIMPYVVVSDVLGPLQISLTSMVTQTVHFFFVVIVVMLSFAVGLTYIYAYYEEVKILSCTAEAAANGECVAKITK